MSLEFIRVPEVVAGDPVRDRDYAVLARSLGGRMRSGAGDGAERVYYAFSTAVRALTCPVGLDYPETDAWLGGLHLVEPSEETEFPAFEPGSEGGINEQSPIGAFVYGKRELCTGAEEDVDGEHVRLSGLTLSAGATLEDVWNAHVLDRGAIDPDTNEATAPAIAAADSAYRIFYPRYGSIWGNRYGGYHPAPKYLATCSDGKTSSYEHFLTNLSTESTVTFPGSCPDVDGHALIYEGEKFYVVRIVDSTEPSGYRIETYSKGEWQEGPYEYGGILQRRSAGHIAFLLENYVTEFRGSLAQRSTTDGPDADARGAEVDALLTTQYYLAPSIGVASTDPETEERVVDAVYPLFELAPSGGITIPAETSAIHTQSGTSSHAIHEDFVYSGAFFKATNLSGTATVEVLLNGVVVQTVTLRADSDGGMAIAMIRPAYTSGPVLTMRAKSAILFTDPAGKIEVECIEQRAMLPRWPEDSSLLARMSAISAGMPDGTGDSEDGARSITDQYFATGGFSNLHGVSELTAPAGINRNGVVDAFRRLSQCVRVVAAENLSAYATDTEGRSVCWFYRNVDRAGSTVDIFSGIGPSLSAIPSGSIRWGYVYKVASLPVTYNGVEYADGATFTGVQNVTEFAGAGTVYEYDGIRHEAPPTGFTNEWLANAYFKVGNDAGDVFSYSNYAAKYSWVNRCHVESYESATYPDLLWHIGYGTYPPLTPEAVTALNYAHGVNRSPSLPDSDRQAFYRSCQVHQAWPEIESAIMEGDELKVTFKTRFEHNSSAPATVDPDPATWDRATLELGERTLENGIMDYLLERHSGTKCVVRWGDAAMSSTLKGYGEIMGESVSGACNPHFILVQLPEVPHEDDNDEESDEDTPTWHDQIKKAWWYTLAMAEGYVDKQVSESYLTDPATGCIALDDWIMEFTPETVCMRAFGTPHPTPLPAALRPLVPTGYAPIGESLGYDNFRSHGPPPVTEYYAETFNQLVKVVNLLTRVRFDMGLNVLSRYITYQDVVTGTPNWPDGAWCDPEADLSVVWLDASLPAAVTPVGPRGEAEGWWSEWAPMESTADTQATVQTDACNELQFRLLTTRNVSQYKIEPIDADQLLSLAPAMRELVDNQSVEFLATVKTETYATTATPVTSADDASSCGASPGHDFWDADSETGFNVQESASEAYRCDLFSTGTQDLGAPPRGDLAMCHAFREMAAYGQTLFHRIIPVTPANTAVIVIPLVDEE